jgi:hypothetical protein
MANGMSGARALQQFGASVVTLEGNIKSLLQSSHDARAEQRHEHAIVQGEVEKLRSQLEHFSLQELPKIWEHLYRLEALQRAADNNVTICPHERQLSGVPSQLSGGSAPVSMAASVAAPASLPQWRLAVVPSPSRSPCRSPLPSHVKAVSPGPSRHSSGPVSRQSSSRGPRREPSPGAVSVGVARGGGAGVASAGGFSAIEVGVSCSPAERRELV